MDFLARALQVAQTLGLHQPTAELLLGGVSSDVALITDGQQRFVVKRSIDNLRVAADWPVHPSRIWREVDALRAIAPQLPPGAVPAVVYESRDEYLYAMTAAPDGATSWKEQLLAGDVDADLAAYIGAVHAAMLRLPNPRPEFDDITFFEELRIDPYYRYTAERHPDLRSAFDRGAAACRQHRWALVHGDFSPKNIMAGRATAMVLDWECVHWGDPAFDTGFILNHLLLKGFHRPQDRPLLARAAEAYYQAAGAVPFEATMIHLPLLLLCRVDGKSPVEYLTREETREAVRAFARSLLAEPPGSVSALFARLS
ncbi:MAG: aminoglycoside phosphotransferase family protein [Bryobacteraceae bacterium]|nr:aminoglycoside phosphotransferase family protein [Bryobacteraceae bacterium]